MGVLALQQEAARACAEGRLRRVWIGLVIRLVRCAYEGCAHSASRAVVDRWLAILTSAALPARMGKAATVMHVLLQVLSVFPC